MQGEFCILCIVSLAPFISFLNEKRRSVDFNAASARAGEEILLKNSRTLLSLKQHLVLYPWAFVEY